MENFRYSRFEDLEFWKKSAKLSADIYLQLKNLRDYSFREHITKTGLSISSNIAEGFERESNKEFINFLSYAKGSCGKLRSQIYIGINIGYIITENGKNWIEEAIRI